MTRTLLHIYLTLLGLVFALPTLGLDIQRTDISEFVDRLVDEHGFEREYLSSALTGSTTKQKILDAISRPAERSKPWHEYRDIFITSKRIAAGIKFRTERADQLQQIAEETGVPAEIIAAIIGVETYYGRITGGYRVLDSLGTLAFDYPPRSKFFRSELEQLFLLAREEELDINTMTGSYAGAMGPPQFIPSSYRAYAVDGNGDGQRDLLNNWDDILASVANYFAAHHWKAGEPVFAPGLLNADHPKPESKNRLKPKDSLASLQQRGISIDEALPANTKAALFVLEGQSQPEYWVGFHNAYVITRYNRSVMYALAVFQLSEAIADGFDASDAQHRTP